MRACFLGLLAFLGALGWADADYRLGELREMESRGDGLATLTDANFDRLARDKGRPYHLFVLFNAADARFKCHLCGPFEEEIKVLSNSYRRQQPAATEGEDSASLPIVFARIDVSQGQKTFNDYELRHAPVLTYFAPTGSSESSAAHSATKLKPGMQYMGELDADNAATFVRDRTGYSITVYRSPWAKLAAVAVIIGSLLFALYALRNHLGRIIDAVRGFVPLWIVVAVSFYYIGVSGILYDIIRGVPFVGYDPKLKRTGLVAGGGSQYVLEGLIIGACNLACAGSLIVLAKVAPKVRNPSTRNFAFLAAAMTFIYAFTHIYSWYRMKTPWYSFGRLLGNALLK